MDQTRPPPIDLRSDTVTRPCAGMRHAMADAEVGDDYYRDDPTVAALEAEAARLLGKPAALFTQSGTQSNLIAALTHCRRGDAYLLSERAHSYLKELGNVSAVAGVQPQALKTLKDGRFDPKAFTAALGKNGFLDAPPSLLWLENTLTGQVLPPDFVATVTDRAKERGLACHLDGARLFNAAAAQGQAAATLAAPFRHRQLLLIQGVGGALWLPLGR